MASNYPTSLDNFTNPTSNDSLNSPSHSLQHANINDAVEAIEAKLGIGTSTAGSATAGHVLVASAGGTTSWTTVGASAINTTGGTAGQYLSAGTAGVAQWASVPDAGLTKISTTSFSAATSVDFTSIFNSTYDNYRIIFEPTSSTNNTNIDIRFLVGTTASTVNYYYGYSGVNNAGSTINTNGNDVGSFLGCAIESGQPESTTLILDVVAPYKTKRTRFFNFHTGASSQLQFRTGSGLHAPQVAYDGIRFLYSGTIAGIFTVYGYQK